MSVSEEKCRECGAQRIAYIGGKCSDLGDFHYNGWKHSGYMPQIDHICGGNSIDINVCLECGQIQGDFPISEEVINERRGEMEEYD